MFYAPSTMKATKLSISLPAEIADEIRQTARNSGQTVSAWLADAAAAKLRSQALAEFLDDWERQHGAITAEELRQAEIDLGYRADKLAG